MAISLGAMAEGLYKEQWRPQYHFTPAHRWIGDPCGLVYHNGMFHAYSWGCAESPDLLHWAEINRESLVDVPAGIGKFTGSVAVDTAGTAGYGRGAYVAAFTSFDEATKKQSQSIAHSRDGGRTFNYYDLNPVIDIWSTEFRDPTVLWDERTERWIMLVAKALEKKVAFYGSSDLKHWEWLSEFGPAGDSERSWECPDMFQLPVVGKEGEKKWVLVVSVNWAREQYFVGDFDGTRFSPDTSDSEPLYIDFGLDYYASRTFRDYDGTLPHVYSIGWVSTWDYAQHVPTTYGKGVWSLPRELSLVETPDGLRLRQTPATALRQLRGKPVKYAKTIKPGVTPLPEISRMDNQYELEVEFPTDEANTFGLNLCAGDGMKVTLSYDTTSGILTLDRTNSTAVKMPKFDRIAFTRVVPEDNSLSLDIFVDKSVVEIYTGDGECVMTALTFPTPGAVGAELFALRAGCHPRLTAWPMASVWDEVTSVAHSVK